MLIGAASVLSLHELGAEGLLLGSQLALQTVLLLLALFLEFIFLLLQCCRLVLHIFELSKDFLMLNLFSLNLVLEITS